jgi:hypothetical protein
VAACVWASGGAHADTADFFEKQVRPILAERCYSCHGPEKQKASLRLDHIDAIRKGGESGPVLTPGDPAASKLYEAVTYANVDLQMPPKGKLSDEEIEVLRVWIADGAYWPDEPFNESGAASAGTFDVQALRDQHWAWQPIRPAAPPPVSGEAWPRSPIDQFLLARLEAEGLQPAPEASREVLIRRLHFDLTGLPPSPQAIAEFVQDESPEAYERAVDALLASSAFGERWGRHWLDLMRYADTYGHEQDYPIRHAWQYRDYVIRALNADVPYDTLVKEHLAGDLMPEPRRGAVQNESVLGTGFLFLHQATHAPVDVRLDQADRIDNQIDVLSKAFLGMTVSCARCHDHKFDAISAKDYFALAGFLRSTRQLDAHLDPDGAITAKAEALRAERGRGERALRQALHTASGNEQRIADYLMAAHEAGTEEAAGAKAAERGLDAKRLERWIAALADERPSHPRNPFHTWRTASDAAKAPADQAFLQGARQATPAGARGEFTVYEDFNAPEALDDWFAAGEAFQDALVSEAAWFEDRDAPRLAAPGVAHSGLASGRLQGTLRSPDFTIEHDSLHFRAAGRDTEIRLVIEGYELREFNPLLFDSTLQAVNTDGDFAWYHMVQGIGKFKGRQAYIELRDNGNGWIALDEVRFSNHAPPDEASELPGAGLLNKPEIDSLGALATAYGTLAEEALGRAAAGEATTADTALVDWLLKHEVLDLGVSGGRLARVIDDLRALERGMPEPLRAHVATDGTPKNEYVHLRGSYKSPGDEVPRRFLEALGGKEPLAEAEGSGRLALAERMFEVSNPLPARVMANRVWHHLFGRGIVPSVDNFGVLGAPPSHPELLDHLAAEFYRDGWSIKRLIKRLVMTSAYRMSSEATNPAAEERDPDNVLLHRANRRRLEGEAVRDAILASAGTLNPAMYGVPVPAYISPHSEGNRRPAVAGPADGDRRRSIYIEVRRNYLTPVLLAFDFPVPDSTQGRRNTSNAPAQALMLMNDPFVLEQAAALGAMIAGQEGGFNERLAVMFQRTLGRAPTPEETARMAAYAEGRAENDPALWADLCHVAFTLKEFIFIS